LTKININKVQQWALLHYIKNKKKQDNEQLEYNLDRINMFQNPGMFKDWKDRQNSQKLNESQEFTQENFNEVQQFLKQMELEGSKTKNGVISISDQDWSDWV